MSEASEAPALTDKEQAELDAAGEALDAAAENLASLEPPIPPAPQPPPTEAQLDKAVANARQKRADACWASIDEILKANRCELAGHPEYTNDGRTVVRFGVRAL